MSELARWIRQFFCWHEWSFYRNVYGDEIILSGFKRSVWECKKCGAGEYRKELHDAATNQGGQQNG